MSLMVTELPYKICSIPWRKCMSEKKLQDNVRDLQQLESVVNDQEDLVGH